MPNADDDGSRGDLAAERYYQGFTIRPNITQQLLQEMIWMDAEPSFFIIDDGAHKLVGDLTNSWKCHDLFPVSLHVLKVEATFTTESVALHWPAAEP